MERKDIFQAFLCKRKPLSQAALAVRFTLKTTRNPAASVNAAQGKHVRHALENAGRLCLQMSACANQSVILSGAEH
ncbi:MAG: hypothetical protein LBU32_01590 [Clostridiales bacterium]|jgi:hypothetical protein|nr:hypothetical protein [Clostridiales bacterium]